MIGTSFEGANDMKRRQFVLVLLGTALLPACSADAAESVVVYKDAA
jgi:outer membrane biogenesis lipoprotein LolB